MRKRTGRLCFLLAAAGVLLTAAGILALPLLRRAIAAQARPATAAAFTVAVDAGLGGADGGAVGTDTGVIEAGLKLAVARLLEAERAARGAQVVMTRTDDGALAPSKSADMEARRSILRGGGIDLVVSVHMNAFSDRAVSGPMVYYMPGSAEGERLARCVMDALTDALGRDHRAPNPGDYFVVRECSAPAVIVECGFLSNPDDERRLQDPAYQQTLAAAIAAGVLAYAEGSQ